MKREKHSIKSGELRKFPRVLFLRFVGLFCIVGGTFFFGSCGRTPIDLRTIIPSETLIYLETNDLAQTLQTITENENFTKQASPAFDFSVVSGMQVAVAITGFGTSEKQVTDEQSILNLRPEFVAVAETHAWSWQIRALIENNIHGFVKKVYGEDLKLEQKEKSGAQWYVWTAGDGRKVFAAILGTQIFFGNDEQALGKSLLVKKGQSESLFANEELSKEYGKSKNALAFGYASSEGIKKIADVIGISVAVGQSEDDDARGFISRTLPQIMRNTVKGIVWKAHLSGELVEDTVFIRTDDEVSSVLNETIKSSPATGKEMFELLPPETRRVTRYNLKSPQIAFRSLLLMTARNVNTLDGRLIAAFSNSVLEPYGISDSEGFLSAVDSNILTVQLDEEGEKSFVVAKIRDLSRIEKALAPNINFRSIPENVSGAKHWKSQDGAFSAAIVAELLVLGETDSVLKAIKTRSRRKLSPVKPEQDFTRNKMFSGIANSDAVSSTFDKKRDASEKIIRVLGRKKKEVDISSSISITETRFVKKGIERTYLSDFGFIGTIIEQFDLE